MIQKRWVCACTLALSTAACFHQVIQTGRTPSEAVVEKQFVSTWLWGLVPAQPVDVRQQCPSGVAVIESEQSFANGFVSLLTLGIYTPQHVRITCATRVASLPRGATEISVPAGATVQEANQYFDKAVKTSTETGLPSVLRF
jgi:hypothetical protein